MPAEKYPPVTLVGFSVADERVGGGGDAGVTVSDADLVAPPYAAEILTVVDVATALVLTVNVAVVAPAATVTVSTGASARTRGPWPRIMQIWTGWPTAVQNHPVVAHDAVTLLRRFSQVTANFPRPRGQLDAT